MEYFKAATHGLEVCKRILLLMGPAGGGKFSIVTLLKKRLEDKQGGDGMTSDVVTFIPAGKGPKGQAYPPGDSLIVGVGYPFPTRDGSHISTLELIRNRNLYFPNEEAAKRPMPTYLVTVQNKTLLGYARVLGMTVGRIVDSFPEIADSEAWAFEGGRTAYHLGEYVEWNKYINIWVQRHAVCDFDILTACNTWDEMKAAREKRWKRWSNLTRTEAVPEDE